METKLEQIAAKAVKQRPKSLVREIRTPRSVGTGGGRPPPVTRWVWKRSYGRPTKAPPDERGGNRHGRPKTTAPHPDSTNACRFAAPGAPAERRFRPFARLRSNREIRSTTGVQDHGQNAIPTCRDRRGAPA